MKTIAVFLRGSALATLFVLACPALRADILACPGANDQGGRNKPVPFPTPVRISFIEGNPETCTVFFTANFGNVTFETKENNAVADNITGGNGFICWGSDPDLCANGAKVMPQNGESLLFDVKDNNKNVVGTISLFSDSSEGGNGTRSDLAVVRAANNGNQCGVCTLVPVPEPSNLFPLGSMLLIGLALMVKRSVLKVR